MKKIVLLVSLVLTFAATSLFAVEVDDSDCSRPPHGPGGPGHGGMGFEMLVRMKHDLALTDAQYNKIKTIMEKYAELRYEAMENKADRDEMHTLMTKERDAIEDVLTDEQVEKMNSLDRRGPGRGRPDSDD